MGRTNITKLFLGSILTCTPFFVMRAHANAAAAARPAVAKPQEVETISDNSSVIREDGCPANLPPMVKALPFPQGAKDKKPMDREYLYSAPVQLSPQEMQLMAEITKKYEGRPQEADRAAMFAEMQRVIQSKLTPEFFSALERDFKKYADETCRNVNDATAGTQPSAEKKNKCELIPDSMPKTTASADACLVVPNGSSAPVAAAGQRYKYNVRPTPHSVSAVDATAVPAGKVPTNYVFNLKFSCKAQEECPTSVAEHKDSGEREVKPNVAQLRSLLLSGVAIDIQYTKTVTTQETIKINAASLAGQASELDAPRGQPGTD